MQAYERVCESAARAGGRVLLDWLGKIQVTEKAPKDLVTEDDVASQRAIQQLTVTDRDRLPVEECALSLRRQEALFG